MVRPKLVVKSLGCASYSQARSATVNRRQDPQPNELRLIIVLMGLRGGMTMKIEVRGRHGILNIYAKEAPTDEAIVAICNQLYEEAQEVIRRGRALLYNLPKLRESSDDAI